MKWRSSLDSPLLVAMIVAICYLGFLVELQRTRGGDISRLVVAGGENVDAAKVPAGLTVIPNIGGYDGLTFYRLALAPFTHQRSADGIRLDNPAYRQQRLVYPLIVRILSRGHSGSVPLMLVLVNVIAAAMMGGFAAAFANYFGKHAFWGLIVPFYPGFVLTFSRDLAEIVAAMFAMGAIWAFTSRRPALAAILLTCAVLTRETALMLALALGAAWLAERIFRRERLIAPITFALPIVIYVFWQFYLAMHWGVTPLRSGTPDTAIPFTEFARFFAAAAARRNHLQRLFFTECLYLTAVVLTVVLIWRRTLPAIEWRLAWVGYLAGFSILPHTIWLEDFGFLRIFADLFVVSAALVIPSRAPARWFMLLTTLSLWYYLAEDIAAGR